MDACDMQKRAHQGMWAILCLVLCSGANGQRYPIECELSFEKNTVAHGKPIVLAYKLTNRSRSKVVPYLAPSRANWIAFQLVDEKGNKAAALPDTRPLPSRDGLRMTSELNPGQVLFGRLVVSQWVRVGHPGAYRLKADVKIPYDTVIGPRQHSGDYALVTRQDLPITITLGTIKGLARIAEGLVDTIRSSNVSPEDRTIAIESLFSMPQDKALVSWEELVQNPRQCSAWDLQTMEGQLTRLGTPVSLSLLKKVAARYNARLDRERQSLASQGVTLPDTQHNNE